MSKTEMQAVHKKLRAKDKILHARNKMVCAMKHANRATTVRAMENRVAMPRKTRIIPNRSLDPEQILFDC